MSPSYRRRTGLIPSLSLTLVALGSCYGGGDSGPSDLPVTIAKAPTKSGDGQTGVVGEALFSPLQVLITRDGEPVQNVEVQWTAGNNGTMNPGKSESNEDGIAQSAWILGPESGTQSASARVTDGIGSPVSFTAEAEEPGTAPGVTVHVLTVGGNRFSPRDVTIVVNQTVTWVWPEGQTEAHNVSPGDGSIPPRSGNLTAGPTTYAYTFTAPGVYTYYCEAHGLPGGTGMAGTVTVLTSAP
jgi:plastocyanin